MKKLKSVLNLAVVVSALGYFVDTFDLFLFGAVRVASLKGLGVPDDQLMDVGVVLLNRQMLGVLLGGIFWGILGDKRGRVSVLFGSIFFYSAANLANAWVNSIEMYEVLRFIAGFGLAGELGLAVTLVSETLPQGKRGYGTTIVAAFGICGSIAAAAVSGIFSWRTTFAIGGLMGLVLLTLRMKLHEPGLYESLKNQNVSRGNFFLLFSDRKRLIRYLQLIGVGLPVWFTSGIAITFAPEFAKQLGIGGEVTAAKAIFYSCIGVAIGDFFCGVWSQVLKSRKKAMAFFIVLLGLLFGVYFLSSNVSSTYFYTVCVILGFATGYWAVLMTTSAEQFGTNLRATVATTVPNFVRGSVILMTPAFLLLKSRLGAARGALALAGICMTIALLSLSRLRESYEADLEFIETS